MGEFRLRRCSLPGVTAVEAISDRAFARHTHDEFGIGVVCAGAQRSQSGRGMVEASAGDVITVNPGEIHDGAPVGGQARHWRMLYFSPTLVEQAACDITQGRGEVPEFTRPALTHPPSAARFLSLFRALASRDQDGRVEGLLLDLLAGLLGAEPMTRAPGAIERVRALIDQDPAAPLTLADLAKESGGLSRFQVLRGFAAATGFTPHAYLVQRRLDLARRLIAAGVRLSEAAAASGFADQSHMTRAFVARYGFTPGAWAAA